MTIKELENLSGLSRENIRFYQAEGLLSTAMSPGGYRTYSENDLEISKRIRLLRTLHISLEEIKCMHTGKKELIHVLDEHIKYIELNKIHSIYLDEIYRTMLGDEVCYQRLDAQHYLDIFGNTLDNPVPELIEDVIPKLKCPWRRFLARSLDYSIYTVIWSIFLSVVLNANIDSRNVLEDLLDTIATVLLMLFVEPAMLCIFGTTIGKWTLGLRIRNNNDYKLSYIDALLRTWSVIWHGLGLFVPIYNLVRLWKSYKACDSGESMPWEDSSAISLCDKKTWRYAALIGVWGILFCALLLGFSLPRAPKHRGEITVSEFCENYNRFADYYEINPSLRIDGTGKWIQAAGTREPEFTFLQENGVMTGLQLTRELQNSDTLVSGYRNEMLMAIISFIGAQKGYNPLSHELDDIMEQISNHPFEDFKYTKYGIAIQCDVNYSGYLVTESTGLLFPQGGVDTYYSFTFSMNKE